MNKHSNIAIFVPHRGCSHRCSFCDQNSITGQMADATPSDVDKAVQIALNSKNYDPKTSEIAFFGGSFTAIETEYMLSLLKSAFKYVQQNKVCGIRVSTRPDAIDNEILQTLKAYGVTAIELGAQSTCDDVLTANFRGHSKNDIFSASKLIKDYGFSLGLQMMTGLYKSNEDDDINTALDFCKLKPDTVRIYPTIVLENTHLAYLYKSNTYKPQSVEEAVNLCCKLSYLFKKENINVIRLGLHSINKKSYVAGPWHPAFSELCSNKLYLESILDALKEKGKYIIYVACGEISKVVGQSKCNIKYLETKGYFCKVKEDTTLSSGEIKIVKDV